MNQYSLIVKNISKRFRLYHEKKDSVYEVLGSFFNKRKNYETVQALYDVSFDVKRGEMFGIIGRNGGGKTTLLRIISQIYRPDSGSVEVNGRIVPILALGLGFHPELTAIDNIYQSSVLFGFNKREVEDRINKIIKFAELERYADSKIKNFSSGMRLRLAFATAINSDPDILLLDEVFAVGDIAFQEKCLDAIMSLKKENRSIIFVSHDMNPIKQFCDRVMFLKDGKVDVIGEPQQAISAYVDYLGKQDKN